MAIVLTKGYPGNDLENKNCTFCFVGEHATLQNEINESATTDPLHNLIVGPVTQSNRRTSYTI